MSFLRVKICGITNLPDALAAAELGADALGFVFYDKSARYIAPDAARMIIRELSPFAARIGVFVNQPETCIMETVYRCGLSAVQLHGNEPAEFLRDSPVPVIRAIRVRDGTPIEMMRALRPGSAVLLDSYSPDAFGGTGVPFDWDIRGEWLSRYRIIIAGGLTEQNVRDAVELFRPFGVDVSSGVESTPGIKDHDKIRRFIEAAKNSEVEK